MRGVLPEFAVPETTRCVETAKVEVKVKISISAFRIVIHQVRAADNICYDELQALM